MKVQFFKEGRLLLIYIDPCWGSILLAVLTKSQRSYFSAIYLFVTIFIDLKLLISIFP